MHLTKKTYTLKADDRLKRKKLFDEVFTTGKSLRNPIISVFYKEITEQVLNSAKENSKITKSTFHLQAAFTASKRKFKKAVDRNKLKRLMREAYRLQCTELKNVLKTQNKQVAIVFVFTFTQISSFIEVKNAVNILLQNLQKHLTK